MSHSARADDLSNGIADGESRGSACGGDRPVSAFVSSEVITLRASTTLRHAAVALRSDDVSLAVVGDGEHVDGVISERDLVEAIAANRDLDATTIAEVASHGLKWAVSTSTVSDVAEEMLDTSVRHVLVCHSDGTLAGVVSMRDLLAASLA